MGIPRKGEGLFEYGREKLTEPNTLLAGLSECWILQAGVMLTFRVSGEFTKPVDPIVGRHLLETLS